MAIRRTATKLDSKFTTIPNEVLRDTRLSLKARGLLSLLMSHKVGWVVSIESLARENPEGKAAIRSAVNELEEYGYLQRERVHSEGHFQGYDYTLSFDQVCENRTLPFENQTTENQTTENQTTDNRTPKNTIPKKTITKENQIEEQGATSTPAKTESKPLHQEITTWVYDQTKGGINFAATMGVIKHHLKQGRQPKDVADACLAVYKMGKPITNQTLGQYMDGHLSKPAFRKSQQERQAEQFEVINNLAQHYPLGEETEYEPY